MKFKFRYDSVIAVKEILIREKERDLRQLNAKIETQKKFIARLRDEALNILQRNGKRNIRSSDLQNLKNYQNYLIEKEKRETEKLKTLIRRREQLVNVIVELNKEKKIIEKLKEKYFENFIKEENKRDEKAMNDFAIQSFSRRKR